MLNICGLALGSTTLCLFSFSSLAELRKLCSGLDGSEANNLVSCAPHWR